ncbi:hypothetical protein [Corynebacterium sp. HMSC069E04]|uniref:hypothetical protein n=1 Tax=Corynebacterium sp. HMSC069E04 TaxID=1739400 RepID=UPI0008A18FE1|nr:hypothetical protein [Corynebacterium sp. HMSC069E04]OFS39278.1 hypothetical protein HMPREF2896_06310 [Corynebacterium sp. HMSC069E04]
MSIPSGLNYGSVPSATLPFFIASRIAAMTALDGLWERERIVPELGLYTYKIVRLAPTTRNILQASGIKIEIAAGRSPQS